MVVGIRHPLLVLGLGVSNAVTNGERCILVNFRPFKANLCSATRQNLFAIDARAMAAYANMGIGWNSVIPPSGRLTKSSKPKSMGEDPKLTIDLDERIPHHQYHTCRVIL